MDADARDVCIICMDGDAPPWVCPYGCRMHVHAPCLAAWHRRQYRCTVCRRSMLPRWLADRAAGLRLAGGVAWTAVCLPTLLYLSCCAGPLAGAAWWGTWLFFCADTLLVCCVHDLHEAAAGGGRAMRLFGRAPRATAVHLALHAWMYCAILNAFISARLALAAWVRGD